MFLGHIAVGLAAKKAAPRAPLLLLVPLWAGWFDRHRNARGPASA